MSANVNLPQVGEILVRIAADWERDEQTLHAALPELSSEEVRDRALRAALVRHRYEVSTETFAHLRWRIDRALRTAPAALEAPAGVGAGRGDRQLSGTSSVAVGGASRAPRGRA